MIFYDDLWCSMMFYVIEHSWFPFVRAYLGLVMIKMMTMMMMLITMMMMMSACFSSWVSGLEAAISQPRVTCLLLALYHSHHHLHHLHRHYHPHHHHGHDHHHIINIIIVYDDCHPHYYWNQYQLIDQKSFVWLPTFSNDNNEYCPFKHIIMCKFLLRNSFVFWIIFVFVLRMIF